MSALASRVLIVLAGLPIVLGIVWLGGWWLFALALVAGIVALHELYLVTASIRRSTRTSQRAILLSAPNRPSPTRASRLVWTR